MIPNEGTALNPIRAIARFRIRHSRWSLQNMRVRCTNVGMKESKRLLSNRFRMFFQGQESQPRGIV